MESSVYSEMDDKPSLQAILSDWQSLSGEFMALEEQHGEYVEKVEELHKVESDCLKKIKHHKYRSAQIRDQLKTFRIDQNSLTIDEQNSYTDLLQDIDETKVKLTDMSNQLPRAYNGLYLSIILGSVNVSLTNKDDKFRYKLEYEKFKMSVTSVIIVVTFLSYFIDVKAIDAGLKFLLVWYYCTLTIRESILRLNGSRIKGWWVFHHYASCFLCAILLIWADGVCYRSFRVQFIFFTLYIQCIQLMQSQYQKGCLYRLRSLGHRHTMDITVEGFHSWMFKGLTFLLPFLIFGYIFQFYNAYCLIKLTRDLECEEWQPILLLSFLFFVLGAGNSITTGQVIWKKLREQTKRSTRIRLTTKYSTTESPMATPRKNE